MFRTKKALARNYSAQGFIALEYIFYILYYMSAVKFFLPPADFFCFAEGMKTGIKLFWKKMN